MLVDEFDKKENNNVKNNINNLISEGDLKKAKELINQYEDIRENDIEIYSMKSVISIMKNDLKKAKEIILAGLKQEQENFDLLYNLGYIYENNNNYKRAYLIYNKAEENVQSKEQKQDVEEGLKRVGEKLEKKTDYNDHYVIKNDKNKISCNPFFIVGCGRSGSTLVRSVLNTHQKISIPPENITLANMIKTYNELNFVAWEDVVGATIDEFKDNPQYSFWEIDLKKLRKNLIDLNEGERTLRKLIDVIYLTFAQNNFPQATMWGDKTPLNSLNISLIDQVFNNAKYIHLIRDGRDVVSSYLNSTTYVNKVENACKRWLNHINKVEQLGKIKNENNYLELYYEDFVSNPVQEMKRICNFLNITYHEEMLNYQENLDKLNDTKMKQHSNLKKPINTNSIGKWESNLTNEQKRVVKSMLNSDLIKWGYDVNF
jgi:tetratricopeptide (TPR) repeat protein